MRITVRDIAYAGAAASLTALCALIVAPLASRGGYWESVAAPVLGVLAYFVGMILVLFPLTRRLALPPSRVSRLLVVGAVAAVLGYVALLRGPWVPPGRDLFLVAGRVLVTLTTYALLSLALPRLFDLGERLASRFFPQRRTTIRRPRQDA